MFSALGMELEPVRLILKNEINEICVCTDLLDGGNRFYTVILILDASARKTVAWLLGGGNFFGDNVDFLGSFVDEGRLGLVFRYQAENRLSAKEGLYVRNFAQRKELALNFLAACANCEGALGTLALTDRNVNITPDRHVYFNYFLDFDGLSRLKGEQDFLTAAARCAFEILSREYAEKYDNSVVEYPLELQAFYKMVQNRSFSGVSKIIGTVKAMPDALLEKRRGVARLLDWLVSVKNFSAAHSMALFMALIVGATLIFLIYQVAMRISVGKDNEKNTLYVGFDTIGEVDLTDKEI